MLDDWFAFFWRSSHPWAVRLALGIPQFLRIHPFAGGNGLLARALIFKHAFETGELDPMGIAIALMLKGRREHLLNAWHALYSGRVGEYFEFLGVVAHWATLESTADPLPDARSATNELPGGTDEAFIQRLFLAVDQHFQRRDLC